MEETAEAAQAEGGLGHNADGEVGHPRFSLLFRAALLSICRGTTPPLEP
jgi:hypothetical protein